MASHTDIHGLRWSSIGFHELAYYIDTCKWVEIKKEEDKPDTRGTTAYFGCKFYKDLYGECHYCEKTIYKIVAIKKQSEQYFRNTVEVAWLRSHILARLKTNDHIIPASKAKLLPPTKDGNIVEACYECNQSKAARDYETFMQERAAIKAAQGEPMFRYTFLSSFNPSDPMEPIKITICHDRGAFDMHLTQKEFRQLYGMCHGIMSFHEKHDPPPDLG